MPMPRAVSTVVWLPVNLVQALFTVLWSAGWISVALVAATFGGPLPALRLARTAWGPGLLVAAGARLAVRGGAALAAGRAPLVVANHQSWIDVPALFRALPVPLHFLAKRELAGVPWLGWYIRAMGMVFVERGAARTASAAVGRAAELLASGRAVVSFPEGTRSRDGRLGHFKSGGFGAALAARAPVVPVALVGSGRVLPPGGFRVRPGTIAVRIGEPIDVALYAPGDRAGLARAAEEAVRRLLADGAPRGA
jgi:1-acyl-sn-glycerol-3-phosphate acyltransferase